MQMQLLQEFMSELWLVHTARNRERDSDQEWEWEQWATMYYTVLFTLHWDGTGTWPIASNCAGPGTIPVPGPPSVQCEWAIQYTRKNKHSSCVFGM